MLASCRELTPLGQIGDADPAKSIASLICVLRAPQKAKLEHEEHIVVTYEEPACLISVIPANADSCEITHGLGFGGL